MPDRVTAATTLAEEQLLDYLQMHLHCFRNQPMPEGWVYKGPYDLLLQHGAFYDGACLLPDDWSGVIDAYPKYCFDNAYRLAVASKGRLRYVEGIASRIIPCPHAWCVDEHDRVVDPTWAELDSDIQPSAYFGVVIPTKTVRRVRRGDSAAALWGHGPHSEQLLKEPYLSPPVGTK